MANILYLDDDEVAIKALEGIVKRSPHQLFTAASADEAWKMLTENYGYDLLLLEVKLQNENAWPIIKRIRSNRFMEKLPVVVYSQLKDKRAVRSILDLDVQNFLFKPFKETVLLEELGKAENEDWRIELAGNATLFYDRLKVQIEEFLEQNEELLKKLEELAEELATVRNLDSLEKRKAEITELAEEAMKLNYVICHDWLNDLLQAAELKKTSKVSALRDLTEHCLAMQRYRVEMIEAYLPDEDEAEGEASEVTSISDAEDYDEEYEPDAEKLKYEREDIEKKLVAITDYPVIESAAAAFQMIANEAEVNLDEIVEIIQRDPGLAAAVLRFSNSSFVAPATVIEDIHQAISVLGLMRVRLLAMSLRTVSDMSSIFKAFRWQDFWMHQVGCAMLSEYIFTELELPGRSEIAYLAGLIHDMGKLLLCEVDPDAYKGAVRDCKSSGRPLYQCERDYFGLSHDHAGLIFAKESELAPVLQATIALQHKPSQAAEYVEFVGTVSLANYLCMKHGVGSNGEEARNQYESVSSHPSWQLFSPWLAPNFTVARFGRELESKVKSLKIELSGLAGNHLDKR